MASTIETLTRKGLIRPPQFLPSNVCYETVMGSVVYGTSDNFSDFDVVGFCIPPKAVVFPHLAGEIAEFGRHKKRFRVYQQHHIFDPSACGGNGRTFDLNIYSIVVYLHLCMECNPNMIDSLFTPQDCVLHATKIANMVRDKRKMFLHKGAWHRFRGYAYSQLHKMGGKQPEPGSKRSKIREAYGYDCYVDSETEFLTSSGWKRYDDIDADMLLATVIPETGELQFQKPTVRVDKMYTGTVYTIEPYMSRCVVTERHKMLVSPAHRNPNTNFSYKYFPDKADWKLIPIRDLQTHKSRSWFHVRRAPSPRMKEYPIDDSYLRLAGLFVSEGTLTFHNGKVHDGRVTQTPRGNPAFYPAADSLISQRYNYDKETVWRIPREQAEQLYSDFGHGSLKGKKLPDWCCHLSHRQAAIFFEHLMLGDGTPTPNGDCYYTANRLLAGAIQAMLIAAGHVCSVRGPYTSQTIYGQCTMYQVYRSREDAFSCVDFKKCLQDKEKAVPKSGHPIKASVVHNCRVVCFDVPNSVLVTRSKGKIAIHSNTKFAYHTVRLLLECEQILENGDIDLRRDREYLKAIKRGEVSEEEVRAKAAEKDAHLEGLYQKSKLPNSPDEGAIKALLLECLEEHWGNLGDAVVLPDRAIGGLREIKGILERLGI